MQYRPGIVFALALAVCTSQFTGCAKKSTLSGEKPRVAFVTNNAYEFWTIARRGTEKAAKEFDVEVDFQMPARGTTAEQRAIVEDLLAKDIQAIAVSPIDSANQVEFFDEVAGRVPLIAYDSDLPADSKRVCYVGTDNYKAGRAAGALVKEAMPEGGKVVIYVGKRDATNAIERRQGVLDELAGQDGVQGPELGKYHLVDTMTDDAKQEKCKANVEDTLVKLGSEADNLCLVGLWAYNPPAILAAVKGAKLEGKVRIVGFDENEETLQGVKDNFIYGTIVQQPFQFGYEAIRLLSFVLRDDNSVLPEDGLLYIPHRVIKRDNVQAFWDELNLLKQGS